jgi:hypothetical protein
LPYFNPHSFRDMLVRHAMTLNLSPEAMKAWSQNLGHADVMTTFNSYGSVPGPRQGELVRGASARSVTAADPVAIATLRRFWLASRPELYPETDILTGEHGTVPDADREPAIECPSAFIDGWASALARRQI